MTNVERREFTVDFKKEAVDLIASSGRTIRQVADDLGLGLSTLSRWKRQLRDAEPLVVPNPDVGKELARLRKENEILRQERDLLKNRRGLLARLCAVETGCDIVATLEGRCRWLIGGQTPLKNVAHGLLRT